MLATQAGRRVRRNPFRFWEYFTRPDDYGMAEPGQTPNYLFLIAPLFLLFRRNRWALWLLAWPCLEEASVRSAKGELSLTWKAIGRG